MAQSTKTGAAPGEPRAVPLDALFERLSSSRDGLGSAEAAARLRRYGPNAIEEEKVSALRKLAGYFWGPIAWMIEVAAILSLVLHHWADLAIILVLLFFNAAVGFLQERQAGNAIEQLKKHLALRALVRRDGRWQTAPARDLVPGDVVRLRLGDLVPADLELFEGDYLSVDQSALTGESLPVDKRVGDVAYSGSIARQGEMAGVVTATGMSTFFGRTAKLVGGAKHVSHFQHAVLTIGDYLIYMTLGLVVTLVFVEIVRHEPLVDLVQFALVLTVAAIPVAMPAVLSVTMAVGALGLSKLQAIVSKLESIEEMAGIDILCSDKTGTLTQNRLTLGDPVAFGGVEAPEVVLAGALASEVDTEDPIDLAVRRGVTDPARLGTYHQERFVPFDPVHKRTEAVARGPDGAPVTVTKGAPQVVLAMCPHDADFEAQVTQAVDGLAEKGYRTLAVARQEAGEDWRFLGLLPLYDPPRPDAAETIRKAEEHGIRVKMVTGDNVAIAREIASRLDLGRGIQVADAVLGETDAMHGRSVGERIEAADGFAQVFPEHKYRIVKALQDRGHLVGMTGDGVNDAPALEQADVGIAVSGATDAARAAADLVLTAPGLSVLVRAVEQARRIFERMNSYAIYRIAETIRISVFMVLAILVFGFYPVTAIMIILLALLNDLPIMTIAYDRTWLDPEPVRWDMRRVLTVSTVLGAIGIAESFGLLAIAYGYLGIGQAQIQSIVFLKLAVAGHLTLFVARTKKPFFSRPHPSPLLLVTVVGTLAIPSLLAGFGWLVAPIPWSWVGLVWAYCFVWMLIEDAGKLVVYGHLRLRTPRHRRFLETLGHELNPRRLAARQARIEGSPARR